MIILFLLAGVLVIGMVALGISFSGPERRNPLFAPDIRTRHAALKHSSAKRMN
jgi:hypothetical protein